MIHQKQKVYKYVLSMYFMESKAIFEHRVSKGSRFNQIYIPREMNAVFEAGDIVEVRLVRKKEGVYYSKPLQKIGEMLEFKRVLIKQIFLELEKFREIKQIFIIGSFLTEKADYRDIDILLISNQKNTEEKAYNCLSEKMQLKFHVMAIPEEKFQNLVKICPLTRSMLYYFASDKMFLLPAEIEIDKNHLNFLLMMPEDLLKLDLQNSRVYFDGLRRLIAIENFLVKKEINPLGIKEEMEKILGVHYPLFKNNEFLDKSALKFIRIKIKFKLVEIIKLLNIVKDRIN